MDDIVVKSKKREEHFYVLKKVFKRCRISLPKGRNGVFSYRVCYAKVTQLFLGLQSIADDQVSCHQSFVVATNPLWQNILVVVTIVAIRFKNGDNQGGKKPSYSISISRVSRRGRIPAG